MSPLIRNDHSNAELRQFQDTGDLKGAGIHTHAAVKTQQLDARTGVRIRQPYAIDRCRHAMSLRRLASGTDRRPLKIARAAVRCKLSKWPESRPGPVFDR
jgi:hypothetical protein